MISGTFCDRKKIYRKLLEAGMGEAFLSFNRIQSTSGKKKTKRQK